LQIGHDRSVCTTRLHEPGVYATAQCGHVFVIYYGVPTTLERERRIAADYLAHCGAVGGRCGILAVNDGPLLPLPPIEVRAHWRQFLAGTRSVDAVALVARGLIGIAGAAMINLLEHVMDPAFGVPLKAFVETEAAIAWLASTTEFGTSATELLEQIAALRNAVN
jgi:hypothetical protein